MTRITTDDLASAAEWLNAYEAEDGDGERNPADGLYEGTDDVAARMYRVADWLHAEIVRRREEALIREVTKSHVEQTGSKPTRTQVRAAIQTARERNRAS